MRRMTDDFGHGRVRQASTKNVKSSLYPKSKYSYVNQRRKCIIYFDQMREVENEVDGLRRRAAANTR